MFTFIRSNYKKGDKLHLRTTSGEVLGEIIALNEDSIILKSFDGKDLYVSDIPKEILEFYILTKNNIDSHHLKNLEKEDKLDDLSILFNQYHLVQYCDSIDTVLPMDVIRCDFHYENIEGQRVIGNYYVPHFYVTPRQQYLTASAIFGVWPRNLGNF